MKFAPPAAPGADTGPVNQPSIGAVIGGMRLDSVAGAGGMGTVFKAFDLTLERTVALKVISANHASDQEFRERFRREARLAAALDHPHVVPVLRAGEDGGHLYLAMRFVEGTDLAHIMHRRGRLSDVDAVEIVGQVGSALDAAHSRGLVHRDVKPANVLVTDRGGRPYCYLTDFGITRDLSETGVTQTGMALGTVDYMSPEQATRRDYDGRADQYSLACVLFQLLAGQVPYSGQTPLARVHAHLQAPIPDVRAERPELSEALADVVRRGMAKSPADRFRDCAELAAAARTALLQRGAGPAGGPALPPAGSGPALSPAAATPGPRHTRRTVVLGTGVVAAGLLGGGAYLRTRGSDAPPTRRTPTRVVARVEGKPIRVPGELTSVAGNDTWVWVSGGRAGGITQIDVARHKVSRTVQTGGGEPSWLGIARGKVWVWAYSSAFSTYDAVTGVKDGQGEGAGLVRVEEQMRMFALADPYLWFTVPAKNAIGRVDIRTREVKKPLIAVGSRPLSIEAASHRVHVVVADGPTLQTRDAESGASLERVPLPNGMSWVGAVGRTPYVESGSGIARVSGKSVSAKDVVRVGRDVMVWPAKDGAWALDTKTQRLQKLAEDLRTAVGAPVTGLPAGVDSMRMLGDSLWLSDPVGGGVVRVRTLDDAAG